ncbi:hypothetical protein GIB67_034187 [Kingdonia uniflora]|uniref:Uncharacterized protein n=1 Tax=Kingdonia uniflora TaxID=39325 RepID=A0A7J7NRH4_9MAGN|nr:hypothetical protein GIB67_034187 [Kingdonia uniflora]
MADNSLICLAHCDISNLSAISSWVQADSIIILRELVWVILNIFGEEATLSELFQFWPQKDEEERPKWAGRLFYAIVATLFILLLRHHAPDEAARTREKWYLPKIVWVEWVGNDWMTGWVDGSVYTNEVGKVPRIENFGDPMAENDFEVVVGCRIVSRMDSNVLAYMTF